MTCRAAALFALMPGLAAAEPLLVTNPAICDLPPDGYHGELGMVLTPSSMDEIEYYCEFDPPIAFDWTGDTTVARVGWCSEPGLITPMLFAFQYGSHEPGAIYVYWQDSDDPTIFRACPE